MVNDEIPTYRIDFMNGISSRGRGNLYHEWQTSSGVRKFLFAFWDHNLVKPLGVQLTPLGADFVDIGLMIAIADRLCLRSPKEDRRLLDQRWARRIHVVMPVRCLSRWRSTEVSDSLAKLLDYIADDEWTFEFVPRKDDARSSEGQSILPWERLPLGENRVILFSGGLDSFSGVAHLLATSIETIIAVTIANNARVGNQAQSLLRELDGGSLPAILSSTASLRILAPDMDRESSARARTVQFLMAGLAIVDACGGRDLIVCENGYGAINLSMTSDQFGSRAGKGMHPKTLNLVSQIASLAAGRAFGVTNIGLLFSKGQLIKKYAGCADLDSLALKTESCERHTYHRRHVSCGKCGSCVLRRIAFNAAGIVEPLNRYEVDLQTLARSSKSLQLSMMMYQAAELRGLLYGATDFAALVARFPELRDIEVAGSEKLGRALLVNMLQDYLEEFDQFSNRLREYQRADVITSQQQEDQRSLLLPVEALA